MTFQDIFKSSFLENATAVSLFDMGLAMALALVLGLFIFLVYKKTYSGVMYSASFGASLIAMTLITTLVILAVSSNVVLSLGMVGALSIVRFRTPVKEPMDIVFLFWCIAVGIVLAAGLLPLAVFGSLFIGLVLTGLSVKKSVEKPYILVVHCDDEQSELDARDMISSNVKAHALKSKSVLPSCIELNYEVRLKNGESDFVNKLSKVSGVTNTMLVSYNGDYMG